MMASEAWRTRCAPNRKIFASSTRSRKDLQEAYGEAMLELRARKELQSVLGEDEK